MPISDAHGPALEWSEEPHGARTRKEQRHELLIQALQRKPDSALLHYQLGDALVKARSYEEAVPHFVRALELNPGDADASFGLGRAFAELGRTEDAIAHYRQAALARPDHVATRFSLGQSLVKAGRGDEALGALRSALNLDPSHFHALHTLARLLIARGDLEGARRECDASLARAPGNSSALAIKSQVLLELGQIDEARYLLDFDRFVRVLTPAPPAEHGDFEHFLSALERSIRDNPGLEFEPETRTARRGSRADLRPTSDQPDAIVRDLVREATEDYRRSVVEGPSHPFTAVAPKRAALSMWTNVLQEGGYHTPHIHPAAWLSGVYYVKVPRGGPELSGELELGCAEPLFNGHAPPQVRRVAPQEGLLVLFPSYFYHRTIPTQSREERISVAFDLIPKP